MSEARERYSPQKDLERRVRASLLQSFPDASKLFLRGSEDEKGLTDYIFELFIERATAMPDADTIPEEKVTEAAAVTLRVIWAELEYPADEHVRRILLSVLPKIIDTVAGVSSAPGQEGRPKSVLETVGGRLRAFLSSNSL